MGRTVAGVACGPVAWFVVATVGGLVLRVVWPDYADVEKAMVFTPGMMIARLLVGAVSSAVAGAVVAWITRRNQRAVVAVAVLLVALFIPVHYALWERFPPWYHLVFFVSLLLMTMLGAAAYPRENVRVHAPGSGE